MAGTYWKQGDLEVSTGNSKVKSAKDKPSKAKAKARRKLKRVTLIINMGTASGCVSRAKGLCKVCLQDNAGLPVRCYACSAEQHRPAILAYRMRQEAYWLSHTADEIIRDLDTMLSVGRGNNKRGHRVDGVRFNEAGDFHAPECIAKANAIARYLRETWGIKRIWTYTARQDLATYLVDLAFTCKGSGWSAPDGMTCVVIGSLTPLPVGFRECPGDCSRCSLCAVKNVRIAFRAHGGKTNINKDPSPEAGKAALTLYYGFTEFKEAA